MDENYPDGIYHGEDIHLHTQKDVQVNDETDEKKVKRLRSTYLDGNILSVTL